MDAQEKEIDNYGKNDKNWGYNVDEDVTEDINIEGIRIQDSSEADNVVCIMTLLSPCRWFR